MSNPKNTITINGKTYDATTGVPVGGVFAPSVRTTDGFAARPSAPAAQNAHQPRRERAPHKTVAAKAVHHRQDKSKTLMRSGVKNPARHKRPIPQPAADVHLEPRQTLRPHHASATASAAHRAGHVQRSHLVSKFGASHQPVVKKHQPLAVQHPPQHPAKQPSTHPPEELVPKSAASAMLDAALVKAVSHEQPKHHTATKRHRVARKMGLSPRFVSISAAIALVVLVGAYFTYQNLPRIAMRIAASRSGISASYPGYTPRGYAMSGAISYSPGQIVVNFKSKQDQQSYAISQQKSNWNSETLESSYLAKLDQPVRRENAAGRTVFIYGDTNATWIDGGIWYRVDGKANLSTDQLLKLAASL